MSLTSRPPHAAARSVHSTGIVIRDARPTDAGPLLRLMRQLAVFEGYAAQFAVSERDLLERGLGATAQPQFSATVAETAAGELVGYAVVHEIAFTYDLRPTLVLKELFVVETMRSAGLGSAIMEAVLAHARSRGCGRLKWDVLPGNVRAKELYRRLGGRPDVTWEPWILDLAAWAP